MIIVYFKSCREARNTWLFSVNIFITIAYIKIDFDSLNYSLYANSTLQGY